MKPDTYKIETIGRGFLAVMAKPVSGDWIEDEFIGIANAGITKMVSLLERHEEYEVGLQLEKELTQRNGMKFVSYPIHDRGLPSSVNDFSQFTHNLYHQIVGGSNTVIHCRAGIGRTGLVAAGVLLHSGLKAEEAFEKISAKRRVQVPDTEEQRNWIISNRDRIINNR